MDDILLLAILWVIIGPILTLVHELGHGSVALLVTDGGVRVSLGPLAGRWHGTIGRLQFEITPFYGPVGLYEVDSPAPTRGTGMAIIVAGPLASLASAAALYALEPTGVLDSGWAAEVAAAGGNWAVIQFLMTAIPMRYPGWWGPYGNLASDGLRAWRLWRPAPETRGTTST